MKCDTVSLCCLEEDGDSVVKCVLTAFSGLEIVTWSTILHCVIVLFFFNLDHQVLKLCSSSLGSAQSALPLELLLNL